MFKKDKLKESIKEELKKFKKEFKKAKKSKIKLLDIVTNYVISQKGKQMKPMFVFLAAKLNGTPTESTYTAAILIRFLHACTLIHDDVKDQPSEKKRIFSINAHLKSKLSVLLGDYLLAQGLLISVGNKAYDLLEILSESVKEMSEGELIQIQNERKIQSYTEDHLEVIRKKKAMLLASCTASGAKSVGCNDTTVAKMKQLGENLGMVIELLEEQRLYKNQKIKTTAQLKTLSLTHALEEASENEKKHIYQIIQKKYLSKKEIKCVIDFTTQKGGITYTSNIINNYSSKAKEILDNYPDTKIKSALLNILINN